MVFSTAIFLTVFLPLVLVGCWGLEGCGRWISARKGRPFAWRHVNAFILLTSLFFYFWGEGLGLVWLIVSVLFNAGCAQVLAKRETPRWRKSWLGFAVVGNLGLLGWFKYAGFIARSINLIPGVEIPVPEIALGGRKARHGRTSFAPSAPLSKVPSLSPQRDCSCCHLAGMLPEVRDLNKGIVHGRRFRSSFRQRRRGDDHPDWREGIHVHRRKAAL